MSEQKIEVPSGQVVTITIRIEPAGHGCGHHKGGCKGCGEHGHGHGGPAAAPHPVPGESPLAGVVDRIAGATTYPTT